MGQLVEARVRRWGNSLALLIPKSVADSEGIKEGDRVEVALSKPRRPSKKAFGMLAGWRIDPQRMKDEIRWEEAEDEEDLLRQLRHRRGQ